MNRLSFPIEQIRDHYTVVVVGSGYGGAIMASRLARAGQSVCVLERGKEFLAGDFPDTELKAMGELQADTPPLRMGSPLALFDLRVSEDMNAVVGCGLGGTSLINANVALRADPRVLADPRWPAAFRADLPGLMEESYGRAETMLRPVPYPKGSPALAKLAALETSAAALGVPCTHPPINVCFADGINHVGVEQRACNLCGDCVSGCNTGAKNSVNMNYLPDARNHGAEIFTRAAVRRVERRDDRWLVHYQPQGEGRETFDAPPLFVSADLVILAAGTLGSTEILLRSREAGLPLSARLGERFTSNGDVMGFGYNNDVPVNGIGLGHHAPEGRKPVGPCIAGLIDLRHTADADQGMVIEEGALPGALGRFLPAAFTTGDLLDGRDPKESLPRKLRKWWRGLVSTVLGPYHGAVRRSQTYLVMAHDDAGGLMSLVEDRLRIRWPGVGEQGVFRRVDAALTRATRATGGDYVPNPIWSKLLGHRLVTVHPLGGAVMAESAEAGVVNHKGAVFRGNGDAVHSGLYVCDGSIMPRSLGVNPLLTISAVAERCAALIARDRGWTINYDLPSATLETAPARVGISFTETMRGTVAPLSGDADTPFEFTFTIVSEDVDALLRDPGHRARMVGTVVAPLLDPSPLTATEGEFRLLVEDPAQVETRRMTYRVKLTAGNGRTWFMEGYKRVRDDPGMDLWEDTTTLFITVRTRDHAGPVLARGVLKIAPEDFLRQLTTMQAVNAATTGEELGALGRFGRFFAGTLFDTYGGIFARPSVFDADAPPRRKRPLRGPAPQVHGFRTDDGVDLHLTRYHAGNKGPVLLTHGLGVSSAIYTIDTIDTNLVEFLAARGYDIWLLDYRASIALPTSLHRFDADAVATYDYPAAVRTVLRLTGAADLQVVAHCFGATTLCMSMLAGLQGVRSAVCSQVAVHMEVGTAAELKAGMHLPSMLDTLGVDSLTAYVDNHASWQARLFDAALRFSPVEHGERCTSATCHRISFIYGPLYHHDRLNQATHDALHEMFGIAGISALEHLALMVRHGHAVRADGADIYRLHPERLAIPILFIHGDQNRCFLPASTATTQLWLAEANGTGLYTRREIPGYGHIDCIFGKNAATDVYGHIGEHLELTARATN
jgi:cholesterol oxidase